MDPAMLARREQFIRGDTSRPAPRFLGSTRWSIAIAVAGLILASITLLIYGTLIVLKTIYDLIRDGSLSTDGVKHLSVEFVELTDIFLLGTVLYIVALGLYELFIDPDVPLPEWLHVDTLEELKSKLIGVIIVLLAVNFLVAVGDWKGDRNILYVGISVGIVVLALAVANYLSLSSENHGKTARSPESTAADEPPAE